MAIQLAPEFDRTYIDRVFFLINLYRSALRRALIEGVPRDWFRSLEMEFDPEETYVVLRREGDLRGQEGERRRVFSFRPPTAAVAPAVVEALLSTKNNQLMQALSGLYLSLRLATAVGDDIDSFAYTFYGDSIPRVYGESDDSFRQRVACLLHVKLISPVGDNEFWFLPNPTALGIEAYLLCFGVRSLVIPTTPQGNILGNCYYFAAAPGSLRTIHQNPHPRVWGYGSLGAGIGVYDAWPILLYIESKGNEVDDAFSLELVRRARAVGVLLQVEFATGDFFISL